MTTLSTKIVGTYYLGKETTKFLNNLEQGIQLMLEKEPDNKDDPKAIKVLWDTPKGGIHLGYVPKDINERVTSLMEEEGLSVTYNGKSSITITDGVKELSLGDILQEEGI
jgi:hypothetical protein